MCKISLHLLFEWLVFWSLTPSPSPNGEGSEMWGYPSFAACVVIGMRSYPDTSITNHQHLTTNNQQPSLANHQHLTLNTQHPPLAVTLCDICMPKAFCGIETVRKKVLLNLWVLWEKIYPLWKKEVPKTYASRPVGVTSAISPFHVGKEISLSKHRFEWRGR